jgi:hypothetical protein
VLWSACAGTACHALNVGVAHADALWSSSTFDKVHYKKGMFRRVDADGTYVRLCAGVPKPWHSHGTRVPRATRSMHHPYSVTGLCVLPHHTRLQLGGHLLKTSQCLLSIWCAHHGRSTKCAGIQTAVMCVHLVWGEVCCSTYWHSVALPRDSWLLSRVSTIVVVTSSSID